MKTFILIGLLSLATSAAHAQGSIKDCEGVIRYNSGEIASNVLSKLAVWDRVDEQKWSQAQTEASGGITIYDLPASFTWQEFQEERARFQRSFAMQKEYSVTSSTVWQAVDQGTTKAYGECVRNVSKQKFTAMVVGANREVVNLYIGKNENPGQLNRDVAKVALLTGGTTLRPEVRLTGQTSSSMSFARNVGEPLNVTIVLESSQGDDLASESFMIPAYVRLKNVPVPDTKKSAVVSCVQKFGGEAASAMVVTAPFSERLVPGTEKMGSRFVDGGGPGSISGAFKVVTERRAEMVARCASSTDKQHVNFDVWFTIDSLRDQFIDLEKAPATPAVALLPAVRRGVAVLGH